MFVESSDKNVTLYYTSPLKAQGPSKKMEQKDVRGRSQGGVAGNCLLSLTPRLRSPTHHSRGGLR